MMDKRKIIIIVVVLALAIGGYFYWKSTQEPAINGGASSSDSGSGSSSPAPGNTGISGGILGNIGVSADKLKANAIATISKKTGIASGSLATLGSDYLIAWAKAISAGADTFTLNGNKYSTKLGTKI